MDDLFRTPDERFERLPGYAFEPHWHDADGLRMHYLDEGEGRTMLPAGAGMRVVCPTTPAAHRQRWAAVSAVVPRQPAALKRSATFAQSTVFHHASM